MLGLTADVKGDIRFIHDLSETHSYWQRAHTRYEYIAVIRPCNRTGRVRFGPSKRVEDGCEAVTPWPLQKETIA